MKRAARHAHPDARRLGSPASLHSSSANVRFRSFRSSSSSNALGSAESLTLLRSTPPAGDALAPPGKDKDGKDLPTPSSTPTTSRKTRRRSNLFTPSSSKKEEKERDRIEKEKAKQMANGMVTGELGSGRAIPIKQGWLYKRSHKALNKDWKKKYVTLCNDGKLTYHSSLHVSFSRVFSVSVHECNSFVCLFFPRTGLHGRFARQGDLAAVRDGEGARAEAAGLARHPTATAGQRLGVGRSYFRRRARCQRRGERPYRRRYVSFPLRASPFNRRSLSRAKSSSFVFI